MVIPRSFSWSPLSMIRYWLISAWLSRKVCDCLSRPSTSVVLPWSTWAMMAIFLILVGSWIFMAQKRRFKSAPGFLTCNYSISRLIGQWAGAVLGGQVVKVGLLQGFLARQLAAGIARQITDVSPAQPN